MCSTTPQTTTAERRPSVFLSLVPSTSESYPRAQKVQQQPQPLTADALAQQQATTAAAAAAATKARSSSLSSDASSKTSGTGAGGLRVLKLSPVHWGEHQDSHQGDWHEVAVE